MKQILIILYLCGCFGSAVAQKTPKRFVPIQQKIQTWVDSGHYDGASIVVFQKNKKIYQAYFGNYDKNRVVFIASAGKWLAAATIAVLVDEGKLHWEDKVNHWLPEFKDTKGEATLAQLLSHTAGYPDYQPQGNPVDISQDLKSSVENILPLPADTLSGTKFKYGGLAMQVAGRMAEIATGKSWEKLFQEKIAHPLEMTQTHFTPVDSAGGHAPMLGGGARSTLQDYTNFLSMIFNKGVFKGKRILSEKTIDFMQSDQIKNAKVQVGEFVERARGRKETDIYGLGEWREEVNTQGEATLLSSPSWAGAYPWIDKTNGVYGFFLTHVTGFKKGFLPFFTSHELALDARKALSQK
ncbi:serine hydrolase domain-containing protein [Flectobacillus rivi]|uniref:Serine hydrolase domain-containing protein n=1 Tax=Flectobacillus rivi TaxID=2984209 RepID=A0ABT6YYW7_9BACT|nr:serine hydrolase domain-containing protein [Flectobacillus rivi]MDI9874067.1 serine hydrolase domain-containing protein [Flectobacillus rivi]